MRKEDKILDQGRVYAAGLLNKYCNMLIHLEDLTSRGFFAQGLNGDDSAFSNNIWAALVAIVKGHADFIPFEPHVRTASLSVCTAPMKMLTTIAQDERDRFTSLVASAAECCVKYEHVLLNLMDVSPLLKLVDEVSVLQKIYKVPPNGLEYKKVSAEQIPHFFKFKNAFEEDHNKGPLGLGVLQTEGLFGRKGFGLIKFLRSTTMSRQLEEFDGYFTIDQVITHAREQKDPNSRTKEILKKLGIQYATKDQVSHLLNEQNFLITVLRPIILEYLLETDIGISYIKITENNTETYLDNREVLSLKLGL